MNSLSPERISQIEQFAQAQPLDYRRKVLALACLGYAYFFLIALAALSLGSLAIYALFSSHKFWLLSLLAKFFWAPFALVFLLGRVFFLKLEPPEGLAISAQEFPQLFAEIEAIRQRAEAQPIHQVLITLDFNAAVASLPRFGLFGWPRHYLLLGLPLLQSLDRDSLCAVLAHEFGHLSRAHTRTGHWIYRLRQSWAIVLRQLELQRSWSVALVRWFLRWYAPYFTAYSFVLARQNEYEADQFALQVSNRGALSRALSSIYALADREQAFWQQLGHSARHQAQPPAQVLHDLRQHLSDFSLAQRWLVLRDKLRTLPSYHDTHPGLHERLEAAKVKPHLRLLEAGESAAEVLLGTAENTLMQRLEQSWQAQYQEAWQAHYQEGQGLRQQQQQLEETARSRALTAEEEFQLGRCLLELNISNDNATPIHSEQRSNATDAVNGNNAQQAQVISPEPPSLAHFRRALELQPEHSEALFHLGRALAERLDPACESLLQRASQQRPMLRLASAEALLYFATQCQDSERQAHYYNEYEAAQEEFQRAHDERNHFTTSDRYSAHTLSCDVIEQINTMLQQRAEIRAAYLVTKAVKLYPESPCYVLVLKSKEKHEAFQAEIDRIRPLLVAEASLVFFTEKDARELFNKLRKVKGAMLFTRKKKWW